MKSVVITGASSGIGYTTCKLLIEKEMQVFGSVRNNEDAKRLSQELGKFFTPLLFDVTDEKAVQSAARSVREKLIGKKLFGLINNAGIFVPGPLLHITPKDFRNQLEVNLVGTLIVTQAFSPLLGSDLSLEGKPGRILNLSSILGKISLPFMGAYGVTKHGLQAFSDTLRQELMLYGIDVITISPGPVNTPIYNKGMADAARVEKSDYDMSIEKFKEYAKEQWETALVPEKVSKVVLKALTAAYPKVQYTIVSNKVRDWLIPRILPKRMLNSLIAKKFGLSANPQT